LIVRSSSQVPRRSLLKRFPIPRNFGVAPDSRIVPGRTWPAPASAIAGGFVERLPASMRNVPITYGRATFAF
jgi:hypothetical protein